MAYTIDPYAGAANSSSPKRTMSTIRMLFSGDVAPSALARRSAWVRPCSALGKDGNRL